MKRLLALLWLMPMLSLAADINITNIPTAGGSSSADKVLGLTNTTHTALIPMSQIIGLSANAATNGYPWTNLPASSVAASNVTSGGVLIPGTVSATPLTAGYALGTDGSTRIWTNSLNGVSIGGNAATANLATSAVNSTNFWGSLDVTNLPYTPLGASSNAVSATYVTTSPLTNHVNIANVDTPGAILTNGQSTSTTFSNALTVTGNITNKGSYFYTGANANQRIFEYGGAGGYLYLDGVTGLFFGAGGGNAIITATKWQPANDATLDLGDNTHRYKGLWLSGSAVVGNTLTPTNGVVQMIKPSFTTNFTCTTNLQVYLCNGTNQVVTLPNAAYVPNVIYRFASTNGHGSFTITNATGAQTIRDGTSLSFNQIGIGSPSFFSDGAQWWPAARTRVVMPTAQFSCSTNIPLTLANTAYPVTFNSIDFNNSQGIALVLGTNGTHFSRMWITNSGQYQFAPSIVQSYNGNDTIRFWFRSSNTNIPNSCTPSKGQNGSIRVITVPFVVNVTAPTDFEIWAESDSTGEELLAQAASGNYPAAPSIICPIWRISDPWP